MDCEENAEAKIHMLTTQSCYCEEESNKRYQIWAAVAVCYICICGGNLSGFTSPAIPSMRQGTPRICAIGETNLTEFEQTANLSSLSQSTLNNASYYGCSTFINEELDQFQNITDSESSWIGGLAPLGAGVGSIFATVSVKMLGPKGSILFLSFPLFVLSWVITAAAQSIPVVYIGRFVGGIALGLTISSAPLYIVDTASLKLKGPLGTLTQFLFTLGVLISFILGSLLNWRQLAWSSCVIVFPSFLMLISIPESPAWLVTRNRLKEAEFAFYKLRGRSADFKRFLEITSESHTDENQNPDADSRSGISILWKLNGSERKSCAVAIALCIFQQLCGINGINYYTLTIFKAASEGSAGFVLSGHLSSIIVAAVFCLGTFPSYFLIEKFGRKLLLIISIGLMILSSSGLGSYFFVKEKVDDCGAFRMIPLICIIIFVLAFSSGFGPILYILVAEILSPEIRSVFSPLATGINWLSVFVITKTFPDLIAITGIHGVFWLYSSLSVVGLIFVICCVPETKGKTEKEIEKYFW